MEWWKVENPWADRGRQGEEWLGRLRGDSSRVVRAQLVCVPHPDYPKYRDRWAAWARETMPGGTAASLSNRRSW